MLKMKQSGDYVPGALIGITHADFDYAPLCTYRQN